MKVLVTGDRNWTNQLVLEGTLDQYSIHLLIEGCCPTGADRMAEEWAEKHGIPVEHHPADWEAYGRAAGPIRNSEMVARKPDLVIAFHSDLAHSRGTKNTVITALKAEIPVKFVE